MFSSLCTSKTVSQIFQLCPSITISVVSSPALFCRSLVLVNVLYSWFVGICFAVICCHVISTPPERQPAWSCTILCRKVLKAGPKIVCWWNTIEPPYPTISIDEISIEIPNKRSGAQDHRSKSHALRPHQAELAVLHPASLHRRRAIGATGDGFGSDFRGFSHGKKGLKSTGLRMFHHHAIMFPMISWPPLGFGRSPFSDTEM